MNKDPEIKDDNSWKSYINMVIAAEISSVCQYYDSLIQWCPLPHDDLSLFKKIKNPNKEVVSDRKNFSGLPNGSLKKTAVLLNGNLNHEVDIQFLLSYLKNHFNRRARLIIVAYNPYLKWLYRLANALGLRKGELPNTFLTKADMKNLAKLSGMEIVRFRTAVYCPVRLGIMGTLINTLLPCVPILKWFCFVTIVVLRPVIPETGKPSLSIIIPARNERGNIEKLLIGISNCFREKFEVIFVEGHSKDNTWEEIERLIEIYKDRFPIFAYRQDGIGKADAVKTGFARAHNDLLTILDADISLSPEVLERFYEAYCNGLGDFVNGNRLVYPTEGKSMLPLNKMGNFLFARILSLILGIPIGDTLCGTKLFSRDDYERFVLWQKDFGDFDPFGDFNLLFPAALQGLGIISIPFRYKDRTYGKTNISRFYHGFMLLKMTIVGLLKISFGRTKLS